MPDGSKTVSAGGLIDANRGEGGCAAQLELAFKLTVINNAQGYLLAAFTSALTFLFCPLPELATITGLTIKEAL